MPDQREIAIDLMQQQRFAEAIPVFISQIEAHPDDWSLYYMAGQCFRFTENLPGAMHALQRAADLKPDEAQVFLALGIVQQLAEDYKASVAALEHAIQLAPTLFYAYNSLGLTYRKLGAFNKALEWYSRAAEGVVDAISDEVFKDRENCFQEELVDGEKTLTVLPYAMKRTHELLRSDPMYATLKNNMGVCLVELGDTESAEKQFREAIEFIPDGYDYPDPYVNLESIS